MKATAKNTNHEPLFHIIKRDSISLTKAVIIRVIALLLAALTCGLFIKYVSGYSISETYGYMFQGTFRNSITINTIFKDTAMLLMFAVALAPAFKMRFWNIGAQGQVLAGGLIAATWLFYLGNKLSDPVLLPLMLISAMLIGGLWAAIPALFKIKFGTNETLFTLMMNYIAIQLVAFANDIWKGIKSALGIISRKNGSVGALFGNSYGWIYVIAAVTVILMYIYMNKTKHGYEISVVGETINTARYAGINESAVIVRTVFISGAICGLIGFLYVSNLSHTISIHTGGSYGFTAITVAWLAKFNPIFMAAISLLISFISCGSTEISNKNANLNASISDINTAIFLFFILGCEFFINFSIVPGGKLRSLFKKKAVAGGKENA